MLHPGQLVNKRYRILEKIAEGGQSTVYLAADGNAFGHRVVVKQFKLGAGTSPNFEAALRQFETSARMLAQLHHAGIVQVIEYVVDGDVPLLITEYVEGETLEHRMALEAFGLPEAQVIDMAEQLCDVLSYLHNQKPPIIYRDLTPGNIIISPSGKLKLIDFGIARTVKAGKAADTELFGTTGYASPEQYGNVQTGPYSDVYSLGATLLYAVSGFDPSQTPFMLPRADRVNPDLKEVSPTFADAIAKATHVQISIRFQTVEEFRRAFRRARRGLIQPREERRPPVGGATVGALVGAALVAILLFGGIGLMLASAVGAFPATTLNGSAAEAPTATATSVAPRTRATGATAVLSYVETRDLTPTQNLSPSATIALTPMVALETSPTSLATTTANATAVETPAPAPTLESIETTQPTADARIANDVPPRVGATESVAPTLTDAVLAESVAPTLTSVAPAESLATPPPPLAITEAPTAISTVTPTAVRASATATARPTRRPTRTPRPIPATASPFPTLVPQPTEAPTQPVQSAVSPPDPAPASTAVLSSIEQPPCPPGAVCSAP